MEKMINLFDDEHWEVANGYPQGTMAKVLRDGENAKTVLLKLPKGFFMAPHSHLTTEQNFLISGEYESAGEAVKIQIENMDYDEAVGHILYVENLAMYLDKL